MHDSLISIIEFVLPERFKKCYEVVKHESDLDDLNLYLDELNIISEEYNEDKLAAQGFYYFLTIQDFPIQ